MNRPKPGEVEERTAPGNLTADDRRIRGVVPYGVESRDLGGWREVIEPGALNGANLDDLVLTVDHAGLPLGRYPTTLELEDRADGLHWAADPPASRSDVREAVTRGDLNGGSWRMVVKKDEWRGDVRHVKEIAALKDVSIVTTGAYPATAAPVEFRSHPETNPAPAEENNMATEAEKETTETTAERVEDRTAPTLQVEARQEKTETRSFNEIVIDEIRDVRVGETRALASSGSPLSPTDFSSGLFDKLRASSIALQSGIPVITTDREKITWPQLTADVSPAFYAEGGTITPGDPTFTTLTSEPQKIAHLVQVSNEVIDDSEPAIVQVLTDHLSQTLALKLDAAIFCGGTALPGITGMSYLSGAQVGGTITTGGTAGVTSYPQLMRGVGLLRAANVGGGAILACNPAVEAAFSALQDSTGQSVQPPPGMPRIFTSTQIPSGTCFLFDPAQFAIVSRQDATVEVDRSRLFNSDQSEIRGKLRANLLAPQPTAVVKLTAT